MACLAWPALPLTLLCHRLQQLTPTPSAVHLQHPITAAGAGVAYLVGRILYMDGYSTGGQPSRLRGTQPAGNRSASTSPAQPPLCA